MGDTRTADLWGRIVKIDYSLVSDDCIYGSRSVIVTLTHNKMVRVIQHSVKYCNWTLKGQV